MRTISGFMDGLFEHRNNTQALYGLNYLQIFFSFLILGKFLHMQNIRRGHFGASGIAEQAISQPLFVFGRQLCARLFINNDPSNCLMSVNDNRQSHAPITAIRGLLTGPMTLSQTDRCGGTRQTPPMWFNVQVGNTLSLSLFLSFSLSLSLSLSDTPNVVQEGSNFSLSLSFTFLWSVSL